MATDILFYVFAIATLIFGALVVANPFSRNPVTSAMFLVLTICAMAGLFVLLNAFFLAAVQILVYAGAVMVLFLFVIMLLATGDEVRPEGRTALPLGAFVAAAALAVELATVMVAKRGDDAVLPAGFGSTEALAERLFSRWALPFEVTSLLLMVAVVGAVVLARRKA